MPSITVSDHVLDSIRALRQLGEDTEDDVLRRLLDGAAVEKERRLRAYETADQDIRSTN